MYKSLKSFTTADYQIQLGQILEDDFDAQDVIQELLSTGCIEEYDGTIEITQNGIYDVAEYENADVNVSGGGGGKTVLPNGIRFQASTFTSFNISDFDISNLTTFESLFNNCGNLQNLNVSNINTTNIENMYRMFVGCTSLESLNLDNFNTENVTQAGEMFASCTNLVSIDISHFDFTKCSNSKTSLDYMFSNCPNLSDLSMNNILKALATYTPSSTISKRLRKIGFSSTQATTCTTLSNWAELEALGWTTGY